MTLKKDKCGYVIKYGIAPHLEELLLNEIKLSPFYSLSFDESLNSKLQKGQMDILVRFWNNDTMMIETRYLTSEFLGGAKADDIMKKIDDAVTKKIGQTENLLQISSDGPNVNLLFLKEYDEKRSFNENPSLLNIGTCGLHMVHGSMKTGEKSTNLCLGKTLKAMNGVLHDTPARRETFEKITETNTYPLPYCGHRWCENETCLQRAAQIWTSFIKFIKYLEKLPKSKQPAKGEGKQFLLLRKQVDSPLVQAKMKFMEYVASLLNEFLRGFQTDQPMVPFLAETLHTLVRCIMTMFILNETMQKANNLMKLLKVDVSDRGIYKPLEATDIGMGAKICVSKYKHSPKFKQSVLNDFLKGAQCALSSLLSHLIEKSPLKYSFLRLTASLNPNILADKSKKELNILRFSKLLEKLVSNERISVKEGDEANHQYLELVNDVIPRHEEKFLSFNKFKDRLDSFYADLCINEFKALWKVFILVFCLFHGQSAVERGFSSNDNFIVENQLEVSLIALRMIHDHMRAKDVAPHNLKISKELRKSVGDARRRSDTITKQRNEEKIVTERERKRKIIGDEIHEVKKKKTFLLTAIEDLRNDADKYAFDAAKQMDFKLLERSNDLRSSMMKKQKDVEELEKMEQDLVLRKECTI